MKLGRLLVPITLSLAAPAFAQTPAEEPPASSRLVDVGFDKPAFLDFNNMVREGDNVRVWRLVLVDEPPAAGVWYRETHLCGRRKFTTDLSWNVVPIGRVIADSFRRIGGRETDLAGPTDLMVHRIACGPVHPDAFSAMAFVGWPPAPPPAGPPKPPSAEERPPARSRLVDVGTNGPVFFDLDNMVRRDGMVSAWRLDLVNDPGNAAAWNRFTYQCADGTQTFDLVWHVLADGRLIPGSFRRASGRPSEPYGAAEGAMLRIACGQAQPPGGPVHTDAAAALRAVNWPPPGSGAAVAAPFDLGPVVKHREVGANGVYEGVWTRRGAGPVYDAVWTFLPTGQRITDTVEVLGVVAGRLIIRRHGVPEGVYSAPMSGQGPGRGIASWVQERGYYWEFVP